MLNSYYDIAVIGSGPAGATFARIIDKKYSVVVIDKKSDDEQSFQKPCGGLLSSDAQKALSRYHLTLPKDVLVDPQIFAVKTIDLKTNFTQHYQRFYINLDRHKFDLWLTSMIPAHVKKVQGACVELKKQKECDLFCITLRENGETRQISARYVIGADGANSIVRRTFFPKKKLHSYVAIQQWFEETHKNPFYSCIFDPDTSDCCSWSISKDNYFIFGGAFAPQNCRANFEKQKQKLQANFGFQFGTPLKTEACLVLRPKSLFDFCCGGGGVFLLGEAAGFISPSSLEGISWAINSAQILSEIFCTKKGAYNAHYQKQTRAMRLKLFFKVLKCPFMYQPLLRKAAMKSGLQSITIYDDSNKF